MAKPRVRVIKDERSSGGDMLIQLTMPSGRFVRYYARDPEQAQSRADYFLSGGQYDDSFNRYSASTRRTPTYKQLSKRKRENKAFDEKEIKDIVDDIYLSTIKAAIGAHTITLDQIANEMISRATADAGFNEYTGNLYNSYQATVVSNNSLVKVLRPSPHRGIIAFGGRRKKGVWIKSGDSRWSPLMKERHPFPKQGPRLPGARKKSRKSGDGVRIRFLKKYEKSVSDDGYSEDTIMNSFGSANFRFGYLQGGGDGLVRSGILLENTAPYADAVHIRYRVLNKAMPRTIIGKYRNKGTNLIRVMTKRALKAAGFNIK